MSLGNPKIYPGPNRNWPVWPDLQGLAHNPWVRPASLHPLCQLKRFWVLKPNPLPFLQTRLVILSYSCTGKCAEPRQQPTPSGQFKMSTRKAKMFTLSTAKATGVLRGQAGALLRNPWRHPLSNVGAGFSHKAHTNSAASGIQPPFRGSPQQRRE